LNFISAGFAHDHIETLSKCTFYGFYFMHNFAKNAFILKILWLSYLYCTYSQLNLCLYKLVLSEEAGQLHFQQTISIGRLG